jgi:two-component system, LytTR family, sensor kinase
MNRLKTKLRCLVLYTAAWTLVALVFSAISYAAAIGEGNRNSSFVDALRLNLVLFYLWGAFSLIIFRLSRRFRIEFGRRTFRNLVINLIAIDVFAAVHQVLHLAILWLIAPRMRLRFASVMDLYRVYFGFGFYIDLIIASLIVIAAHAIFYYQDLRTSELEQSSLKTQLAQAQLRALKMQLHPHFLFNTLHSISSLILEDPPKANSMIARLGDFLRLTLENSDQQLVTVKEEIEFLRTYLEIEQVRFGDRLTVTFDMEPNTLAAAVPHLILQPVVENAIQHAVAPRSTPSHINIAARRIDNSLRLEVKDDGPGVSVASVDRQGVGLNNVRARLDQIYGRDFRFELTNGMDGGLTVVIELPFQHEGAESVG